MSRQPSSMAGMAGICLVILGGCAAPSPADGPATTGAPARPGIEAAAYRCDGGAAFILHVGADAARLVRPADSRVLRREVSASGVKYATEGLLVWTKGEEALIEIDGRRYTGCRARPAEAAWEQARVDGVEFRALGNEPGWILEVDEDAGIAFVTDYGRTRHAFDRPQKIEAAGSGQVDYRAEGSDGSIRVVLAFEICRDDMSGEPFPVRATVTLAGRTYRGCGRSLRDSSQPD